MNLENELGKREEFKRILKDLSIEQDTLKSPAMRSEFFKRLEGLYWPKNDIDDEFRHFYSDIFFVVASIQNKKIEGDINILGQNLELIRRGYKSCNFDNSAIKIDISKNINKLYDHVNLEISRIGYTDSRTASALLEGTINDVKTKMTTLTADIKCTAEEVDNLNESIKSNQKEFVAILGIFAAVVLAFTGGIAFSTSVLENINSVSPYRIIMVALIIGIVLVNIIFSLFYYIDRIIYKKDSNTKPIIISNIILLGLIIAVFLLWNSGYIEQRNVDVFKTLNSTMN